MTDPTPEPTTITITTEMWDEIQLGWRRTVRSLVRLVVVVVFATMLAVGFIGWRSYLSQQRAECTAKLQGLAFGLAFEALAAPPAPNPARGNKVKRGLVVAEQLQNLADYC